MNWVAFFTALALVESGNDPTAVGDVGMRYPAYTRYQIRQPYLDDVNRVECEEIESHWGRPLMMYDLRESDVTARWVVVTYLRYWGDKYEREMGEEPTVETYARMHNGGPRGWERSSTGGYWRTFRAAYNGGIGR